MIVVHRVIKPKYRRGGTLLGIKPKYQYGGHGVWLSGKKFVKDNIQNLINSVSKKKIAHKIGDALVSGATSSLIKAADKSLQKTIAGEKKKTFKVTQSLIDSLPTVSGTGITCD